MKPTHIAFAATALLVGACHESAGPTGPMPPYVQTSPPTGQTPSVAPDPLPVVEGDVTQLSINGMTVLVQRVPGAELASAQLYIRGGVRNWTAANAGVEQLAVSVASQGGAGKLDKDAFARRLATMGSDVSAWSANDHAGFSAKSLTASFDETFQMMTDAFLSPAMPANQIEIVRQRMLSRLRHEQESPDARLGLLQHFELFHGHPYENRSSGTLDSVAKLGAPDITAHLARLRETSRLLLVVVGDLDASHVAELVKARFGALPRGTYLEAPLPAVSFAKSRLESTGAEYPTNYVQGAFVAPGWRDPDFYVAMVAAEHLQFRLFEEVRTKRNLSYAVHTSFRYNSGVPLGFLYVTAVDPDAAVKVMFDEVKKLKSDKLSDKEMLAAKSTLLTEHTMGTESTDEKASALATALIFGGDWRMQKAYAEGVKRVTADQVKAYTEKYFARLQFEVLGKAKVDQALFGSM